MRTYLQSPARTFVTFPQGTATYGDDDFTQPAIGIDNGQPHHQLFASQNENVYGVAILGRVVFIRATPTLTETRPAEPPTYADCIDFLVTPIFQAALKVIADTEGQPK